MAYAFYGWEGADSSPIHDVYAAVQSPRALYDLLKDLWSAETCAPRMRKDWTRENKTLGQCSITAFLAQDIFGGRVYGVPLPEGGFHCYNEVEGKVFDLTSEQFGHTLLRYENNPEQSRLVHFASAEKKARYELLKAALLKKIGHRDIWDDGIRLDAQIDLPENMGEGAPMVIIQHGFTGHKDEPHLLAVSGMLNALGCATLRFDFYGHGKSQGAFHDHTLYKWVNKSLTVIDYARKLDFVTDLYLCGHSQGGLTAMLAAGMKWDALRGLIPMSPAAMIPEGARQGFLLGEHFDPDHVPDEIPAWGGRTLGGNYVRVAQTIHVEEAIERYKGPVLLMHGDADGAVPIQCSIDAQRGYDNAQLAVIRGDGHCYENHLDQAVEAVRNWMAKQLQKR